MPQVSATGLSAMPAIDRQQAVMPLTPMGKGGNYKSGIRNRELRTENRELHSPGGGTVPKKQKSLISYFFEHPRKFNHPPQADWEFSGVDAPG
jgi:hypothetical protein